MEGVTYSVNVSSIKYNGEELLSFSEEGPVIPPNPNRKAHDPTKPYHPGPYKAYSGLFDSGTTCNLIPDSTVFGVFTDSPYKVLPCPSVLLRPPHALCPQRYLAARGRSKHLMPLEYTVSTIIRVAANRAAIHLRHSRYQINGRTFMLPVSDFDCLESAGEFTAHCLFSPPSLF
jgi:hypothetical protein